MNNWFEVDKAGLAKILARKGLESAVFELIQNAWDEDGVTIVAVTLSKASERGCYCLQVEDNAPAGFADLSHAFTLFAESKKKADPEKRGRFNLGEKLVLAICQRAEINTTTGTVIFDKEGRRTKRFTTKLGSRLTLTLRAIEADVERVIEKVKTLIPPHNISVVFNGLHLAHRIPFDKLYETLTTEIADGEGNLVRSRRKTLIEIYEVQPGEKATLYEMGIPVVETGDKYHYNIGQKVPLTMDRENVPPSFLSAVRVAVYNVVHPTLTRDDINEKWVQESAASPHCCMDATKHYVTEKFGEKRVSFDPSDPEANNRAVAAGYTVVKGPMMHKGAWDNARTADAIIPAGQVFPTHPKSFLPFSPAEVTEQMAAVANYVFKLGMLVLGVHVSVEFGKQPTRERACWGDRKLQFNVPNCGGLAWFDLDNNRQKIDDLIIHEFGHHFESNHLSDAYADALTHIGAKMVRLAREGKI